MRGSRHIRDKTITTPMSSLYKSRRIRIVVKRAPQLTNGDFKNSIGHKSLWPNSIQKLFFCDELTRMVQQIVEHRKNFRPQLYRFRAAPKTLVTQVQTKRIEDDEITVVHCTSPKVTESLPQTYDLVCSAGLIFNLYGSTGLQVCFCNSFSTRHRRRSGPIRW